MKLEDIADLEDLQNTEEAGCTDPDEGKDIEKDRRKILDTMITASEQGGPGAPPGSAVVDMV